jgi:hypothetical protein
MGKQVTVKPGFTSFRGPGPKGYKAYQAGQTIVYTDAEYAGLSASDLRALNTPTTVADPVRPAVDPASRAVNVVTAATGTVPLVLGVNRLTLTGNVTLTFPTGVASGNESEVSAYFTQDATGTRTVTAPASSKTAGAVALGLSTVAGKTDYVAWRTVDGGVTWYVVNKQIDLR